MVMTILRKVWLHFLDSRMFKTFRFRHIGNKHLLKEEVDKYMFGPFDYHNEVCSARVQTKRRILCE